MNNTYFVHIKKEDMYKDDLIETIKNNIYNLNPNEIINENNIIKLDMEMINKINKNNIGRIEYNNNNNIKCDLCDKKIKINSKIKILDCDNKFHIKCINSYFKSSCYLDCPICGIEYLSNNINKTDDNNIYNNINNNINAINN